MGILKTLIFKDYFIYTCEQIKDTNQNWSPNDLTYEFTVECLMQTNFMTLS